MDETSGGGLTGKYSVPSRDVGPGTILVERGWE
jgi:hypothetical protein